MDDERQERRRIARAALRAAVEKAGGPSEVARLIGTSRTHIGNILSGKRGLGKETAMRLRSALRLRQSVLLDLMAPPAPKRSEAPAAL